MGDDRIQSRFEDDPQNVRELLQTRQDWVGPCTTTAGDQPMVGAFAYNSMLNALISIYVPVEEVDAEIRPIALPGAVGIAFITMVLFPLALGLLHRAYSFSQRQLARTNADLRRENAERKKMERENQRLAAFPRENPNPVLACGADSSVAYANPAAQHLVKQLEVGRTADLLPEKHSHLVHTCLEDGQSRWGIEVTEQDRIFSWTYHPVPAIDTVHLYGKDITAHKQADERIKASLKEKETLLQEVYHRVKNNLQIVSSLLNQQATSTQDGPVRMALREMQARVRSMALIHQALYQSDSTLAICRDFPTREGRS